MAAGKKKKNHAIVFIFFKLFYIKVNLTISKARKQRSINLRRMDETLMADFYKIAPWP